MYDYSSLIDSCHAREEEELAQGIDPGAMMLGRLASRLEKNFFPKFQDLGWQFSRHLRLINTVAQFDDFHHQFVTAFRNTIKTRSGTVASYGEAQQPVNVFLRDYVDNIHLLKSSEAALLRPWLHVTLDGVMIYYMQSFFRDDYRQHIEPHNDACGYIDVGRLTSFHRQDISPSQLTEMLFIGRDTYCAWQRWFRQIYPGRPTLLDAIWSLARQTLFAGGLYWSAPQPRDDNSIKGKILRLLDIGQDEVL